MSKKPFDRLTADSIAAEKAGMSYGKWKALHPHTPEPEEKKTAPVRVARELATKKCISCGREFLAVGHSACRRYCSDECQRREAMRRYYAKHPKKTTNCLFCGKEIPSDHGRQFCGPACKEAAYRQRKFDGSGETA